jgi:hypothetical protein
MPRAPTQTPRDRRLTARRLLGCGLLSAFLSLVPRPAAADVSLLVEYPENLADAAEPVPTLYVFNDTGHAIEVDLFGGVPFTYLREELPPGVFVAELPAARCGNGYAPHRIAAGASEAFPLWSRLDHGPGKGGSYRVHLPYRERKGKRWIEAEAISEPAALMYGDAAPAGWSGAAPGALVFLGAESKGALPDGAALARRLKPALDDCVKEAQSRLPWLRGSFSLVVYRYSGPKAVAYTDASLLGDATVNACLAKAPLPDGDISGKHLLRFAVTAPL